MFTSEVDQTMKTLKFLLLLQLGFFGEAKRSLVPQAILQLVQNHYGDSAVKIEVLYNSDRIEVLDDTLKLLSGTRELKITKIYSEINNKTYSDTWNDKTILFFDTLVNFLNFEPGIIERIREKKQVEINFLVYCEDLTKKKLQAVITENNLFESFLIEENGEVSLHTMSLFTSEHCKISQLIETNRFSTSETKWLTEKFLSMEVDNFHGCELVFTFFTQSKLPFVEYQSDGDEFGNGKDVNRKVQGALVEMIEALSTNLNFTVRYGYLLDREDIVFSAEIIRAGTLYNKILVSDPILSASDVFIVPPAESYTSWEKLLLPFDKDTWMWLGITFTIAFLVIFLIRLSRSGSMYDFVIGLNVTTPTLNIFGIFMGVSQNILPRRSVSRFLFTCFVLFCLIMRTAYQGKYFEFITNDIKKKPVLSVEELVNANFAVYAVGGKRFYENMEIGTLKG